MSSYNRCNLTRMTTSEALEGREPDDVIERALVRIRRDQQARRLHRRATEDSPLAASSADAARFRYLDAIDGRGEAMSVSAVADAIGVDRPRGSRLTAELVERGLVERSTMPGDSRYASVRLTSDGQALVDNVRSNRRKNVASALTGFNDEEARTLAELLERFLDAWSRTSES